MNQIKWKAEATSTQGRPFHRIYRGVNPYKENGVHLDKGSPFALRMDNTGCVLIAGGQEYAISQAEYYNLMRASLPNKEHQ
jgi:hypothetical protein